MTGMLLLQAMETSRRHYGTAFLDETIYTDARAGDNPPGADFISRLATVYRVTLVLASSACLIQCCFAFAIFISCMF